MTTLTRVFGILRAYKNNFLSNLLTTNNVYVDEFHGFNNIRGLRDLLRKKSLRSDIMIGFMSTPFLEREIDIEHLLTFVDLENLINNHMQYIERSYEKKLRLNNSFTVEFEKYDCVWIVVQEASGRELLNIRYAHITDQFEVVDYTFPNSYLRFDLKHREELKGLLKAIRSKFKQKIVFDEVGSR
ncbi:hypothetical protein [Paenibacillus polymyxa]|uniref:Uncharacterized protein n=1 Tax=Paenibacillus polymyxa (strain SC2) TaxID=886882 RepID=A0A0D5ZC79_PAEPS|nr:hypothetical protein [Paenibacillus polymyxa]AKA44345.1 hypothetical protein PPSC2_26140 [Paenibacillus polymyxa SC2]WPQ59961.1 hypothetical protein SKN87_27345 [Paenibacillus polymyxa]